MSNQIAKEESTIDRLSIIWKSDFSDKMKRDFFSALAVSVVSTTLGMQDIDANEEHEEKAIYEQHKNATRSFEQILKAAPLKTVFVQPLTSHLTNQDDQDMQDGPKATFSLGFLHMDAPVLADQE